VAAPDVDMTGRMSEKSVCYGVATSSRLLKIIGLFLQNIVSFIGLFCKKDLDF